MEFLLLLLALPVITLIGGLVAAWRYYKRGNRVAGGLALFCALLAAALWRIFQPDLNGIYEGVFLLHGVIVLLLVARPVHRLPAIWWKYLLAGTAATMILVSGINFLLSESEGFRTFFLKPYVSLAFYAVVWIAALLGWLRSRHKSHLNLPLSQTYLWGNALAFAISWLTFLIEMGFYFLEYWGRNHGSEGFSIVNGSRLLFHTAIEVVLASVVIWIWTQTLREPVESSLPAEKQSED